MDSRLSNLSVKPGQKNPIDSNTIRSSSLRDYTPSCFEFGNRSNLPAVGKYLAVVHFNFECSGGGSNGSQSKVGATNNTAPGWLRGLHTLNAFTGRLKPLRTSSPANSTSASVSTALATLMSTRICPFL